MELEMMNLVAQMRDQIRTRDDIIASAFDKMNKENASSPYLSAINRFPALAVLEKSNPEWIEPVARSLKENGACSLDAPLNVRSLHSALSLWKTSADDQMIAIAIYGLLVERGSIDHAPRNFINVLMICSD